MKTKTVFSAYVISASVGIIKIVHDIEDKVYFACVLTDEETKKCYAKIKYDKENRAYFNTCGMKIYLDNCIRM